MQTARRAIGLLAFLCVLVAAAAGTSTQYVVTLLLALGAYAAAEHFLRKD